MRQALALVHYGALTPAEFVVKTSVNAAAMLGFEQKGHLSTGADRDITVLDPAKGCAYMGIALGKIIMIDSVVVANHHTVITTERGVELLKQEGVEYLVEDIRKALPIMNNT